MESEVYEGAVYLENFLYPTNLVNPELMTKTVKEQDC